MTILVTAFGPFAGRAENASTLALRELKKAFPEIRTRILPVDVVIAPKRLKQAIRTIRPDAIVLLGEAAGSKKIRLEQTAWNEMDFRIPDISGRQPAKRPIRADGVESLASTLPLDAILAELDAAGHEVHFSQDPGRYLCNQVFYSTVDLLAKTGTPCMAGFIHLPLASDYATARSAEALGLALRTIMARQASGS